MATLDIHWNPDYWIKQAYAEIDWAIKEAKDGRWDGAISLYGEVMGMLQFEAGRGHAALKPLGKIRKAQREIQDKWMRTVADHLYQGADPDGRLVCRVEAPNPKKKRRKKPSRKNPVSVRKLVNQAMK